MSDIIDRQEAIDALDGEIEITGRTNAEAVKGYVKLVKDRLERLPSAQPTLYGYKIEHLVLIARVMEKEGVSPEEAVKTFQNIVEIVQMIADEQKEIIRKAVEQWT